jgi:hypothetical protein
MIGPRSRKEFPKLAIGESGLHEFIIDNFRDTKDRIESFHNNQYAYAIKFWMKVEKSSNSTVVSAGNIFWLFPSLIGYLSLPTFTYSSR